MKKFLVIFTVFVAGCSFSQQTENVDFTNIKAAIELVPDSSKVIGSVYCEFKILREVDSVYLDAIDMAYIFPEKDENEVGFSYDSDKLWLKSNFKKGKTYSAVFRYEAVPKKALYFLRKNDKWQIWTQGQGKYTSNWLPSIDDTNDKIEFDLTIEFNSNYEVVANGVLKNRKVEGSSIVWHYDMQKPMSSYLVAFAIGKYNQTTETSESGIPLKYYYYPEDSLKVEPTYRYSKQMFDFLENEIGFAYPWQNYKQVPVHDFLYAGMENTTLTIFSDAFVVDNIGFNDKNYVNVNAHELAHQWFGNLVTSTSGEHHWLQEGFATYYALLAERDIFGDDYFCFKLYESALDLGRQDIAGNGTSLLNPKSSSLTFYQRGSWVLHALRGKVGDAVFRKAVKNYLEKYQFANVETSDFIKEIQSLYGKSLTSFVNEWIEQEKFPVYKALELLEKESAKIQEYLMVDCEAKNSKCADYLKYDVSDEAKVKVISQFPSLVNKNTFRSSLKVRQAISQYITKVPVELKSEYESLLDDKSYVTVENALYNLWVSFPEDRPRYLSKTRNIEGFNDKNVRLLWIMLNLNTPFYQTDNKQGLYNELLNYTETRYNADLRMKAFQYLKLINSCNEKCQSNLKEAKSHHNWRMVKFAKDMSEQLEQNKG
ncbi:M1 family metallopeptidase [Winogradskyella ursingii]|uniref:M1 family metallopeptidase n=1 Tax=Winogradskyella ursingii TaxID=2686079 RepID=UPI0015CB740C|nr:M1 family metallopeptidase [Winogradskyella ursingii]